MKRIIPMVLLAHSLWGMTQTPTVIEDLATYSGKDATVFNRVDSRFYKYNNLGQYEMYGVYEVVDFAAPQVTEVEYITNDDNSDLFIGDYCIKSNTRVVAIAEMLNTADAPTCILGSCDGSYPNAFYMKSQSAYILSAKLGSEAKLLTFGKDYLGVKSVFDLNGRSGESAVYVEGHRIASKRLSQWVEGYDYKYMLSFFAMRQNNTSCYDYQPAGMKLYGAKIYEDSTLIMDLTPVVTKSGRGGLKDRLSGTVYTNGDGIIRASDVYNADSSSKGVSTYPGKLVFNVADRNMYRWNGAAWVSQGVGLEDISDERYYKLKNWSYPSSSYDITFQGYKDDSGERTNRNDALVCQSSYEPLWYTIGGLEAGANYRIGFDFTTGGFSAYINSIYYLPFFVQDNNPVRTYYPWGDTNRNNTDSQTLAYVRFPFPAQSEWHIGRNFKARDEDVTLILQFGACEDYIPFRFWFDNICIQKYLYPMRYPDISLSPVNEKIDENEWAILQKAYTEMDGGEEWAYTWDFSDESQSVASLPGVTANGGHVVGINLSHVGMKGMFPFTLLTLPYLDSLNISGNHLTGDIGMTMAAFRQKNPTMTFPVEVLNMSDNRFSGNIGLFASQFGNLRSLDVSGNCLEDVLPMIPATVTSLDIGRQSISRVVPLYLAKLSVADVAAKMPTILFYDHFNRTFSPNISLLGTTNDENFSMSLVYMDGQLSMPYVSEQNSYYGDSGDTLQVAVLNPDGTREGSTFRISLDFDEGDSNFDGNVNVLDLQTSLNYMFGDYHDRPFNFTASNLLRDDFINVQDLVLIIDKLLSARHTDNMRRNGRVHGRENEAPDIADAHLCWRGDELTLSTSTGVTAADIYLAGKANITWNLRQIGFVVAEKIDTEGIHAIIYSLSGAEMPVGETVIARKTAGDAEPVRVLLSDRRAVPLSVSLAASDATAIDQLMVADSDWTIYHIEGSVATKGTGRAQLMQARRHLSAGVYILQTGDKNTQKFTIR